MTRNPALNNQAPPLSPLPPRLAVMILPIQDLGDPTDPLLNWPDDLLVGFLDPPLIILPVDEAAIIHYIQSENHVGGWIIRGEAAFQH